MKKRRKVLSVMLCAAMIASLAACGSKGDDKKSSDDGGKVKLTFSTSVYVEEPHQKAIDALLEAYSKKEPNVEIEFLELVMMDIGIISQLRFFQTTKVI